MLTRRLAAPPGRHLAWLGIVTCQIGASFAYARSASLRQVGVFSNKPLLAGIAAALAFAAALAYLPRAARLLRHGRAVTGQLATVAPFALIVWGAD